MNIFSVALIGVTAVLLALSMKEVKSEYSTYLVFGAGILIFFYAVYRLGNVVGILQKMQSYLQCNRTYLDVLLKIVGITYVAELAAGICKDAGYGSLSSQIELFGKLSILGVSLPILSAVLETVHAFLGGGQ
ncbi:MAG: stage III sporulation protein AD [Lachnospiraceae bacterium]|nr:stage III sporulation protein AD [Lachnospiraceae bacterium]